MQFLLFRLYGAMASWGDLTVGEMRPTALHPSKSALVGLIAAAFGFARDRQDKIDAVDSSVGYAVRMDSSPLQMRDYHTVQRAYGVLPDFYTRRDELLYKNIETTPLSKRDYLCDALYTICLWNTDNATVSLSEIGEALRRPIFHLYLGRKSCPLSLPIAPVGCESDSIRGAFAMAENNAFESGHFSKEENSRLKPLLYQSKNKNEKQSLRYFWEECSFHGFDDAQIVERFVRRDVPRSRTRWQFGERREYHAIVANDSLGKGAST